MNYWIHQFNIFFFKIESQDLSYENRNILNNYLIKHQDQIIWNISDIFQDSNELREFLFHISPFDDDYIFLPFSFMHLLMKIG